MNADVSFAGRFGGVAVVVAWFVAGCATYTDTVIEAKRDVAGGRPDAAVGQLNDALGTDKSEQLPSKLSGENTLVLLERATILQGLGHYELAARDMMLADQQLDWLDIGAQGKAKIGKYIYSGTSVKYRAPAYERLLLNTLNMLNFLVLGDWEEAKVEARRFRIIEHFFVDKQETTLLPGALGFGNYLGGVAFEAAADYDEAARYYSRAWKHGVRTERFGEQLGHLLRMTANDYADLIDGKGEGGPPSPAGEVMAWSDYRDRYVDGELLVVVQSGLAPYKEGKRYPVAKALAIAGATNYHNYRLSSDQREQAQQLAVEGALKWVNFPVLTEQGLPPERDVAVEIGGERESVDLGVDIERQVEHGWDKIKGALMGAAITRMITRAVAGQAAKAGAKEASGSSGVGMLAQIAVEGGMAAADTPDTRSWSMLPARVRFSRVSRPPGKTSVSVKVNGKREEKSVRVRESGPTIVNFSKHR